MKKSSKRSAKKNKQARKANRRELDKRLIAYSVAFGAALAVAESADGTVIYTDLGDGTDISFPDNTPYALNFDGGAVDFNFKVNSVTFPTTHVTSSGTVYGTGLRRNFKVDGGVNTNMVMRLVSTTLPAVLPVNAPVRGTLFTINETMARQTTRYSGSTSGGLWAGQTDKFLGLRFVGEDAQFHYGYARLTVSTADSGFAGKILGYAYETDPDTQILTGAVPEPSLNSLGMLALGAVGVLEWKRRKKKGQQA